MRTGHIVFCLVAGSLILATSGVTRAGEKKGGEPSPIHKELARRAGEYITVAKFNIKPGAAPMESKGTATLKSAEDGNFLLEENTGTMFGQPYKGVRIMGYNDAAKEYEAVWTYSMATAMMTLRGKSKD